MRLESLQVLFDNDGLENKYAELQVTSDGIKTEVGKKIGTDEVISRINQSAESVKIQAQKVEVDGTLIIGKTDAESIATTKANAATGTYITAIDNNGIRIHAANNPTSNYSQVDASGMTVYKGGTDVATFGDTCRVGIASSGHTTVKSDGMHIWTGAESTATNEVAFFGATARIGATNKQRVEINTNGVYSYSGTANYYSLVNSSGMSIFAGSTTAAAVFGSSSVELGKNSASSVIKMCAGNFQLSSVSGNRSYTEYSESGSTTVTEPVTTINLLNLSSTSSTTWKQTRIAHASSSSDTNVTEIVMSSMGNSGGEIELNTYGGSISLNANTNKYSGYISLTGITRLTDGTHQLSYADDTTLEIAGKVMLNGQYLEESAIITTFESGWAVYNSSNKVIVRRFGNVVHLHGIVKNTAAIELTAASGGTKMFSLPSSVYYPEETVHVICNGSSQYRWLLEVQDTGAVTAARYSAGSGYPSVSSGSWFPFDATWVVDN